MEKSKKTVFYSWQSDLPNKDNHYLIKAALERAIRKIDKEDYELEIRLDHDTLKTSGSPDIKEVIFRKIAQCEIFICDLSIVNSNDKEFKKLPNHNVLIELGYAAAKKDGGKLY